jgi:non-canonical purine NTP pyrophosphatase, rdgB/HAM1 family
MEEKGKQRIIFATNNAGKIKEIKEILADLSNIEVLSLKEANINIDIIEDGKTFEENAIIKAKAIHQITKGIVLADDSGLEVDYLNKEPGVYSARYMGEDTSYKIKNQNIMDRLNNVPLERRTARFVCAIAAITKTGEIWTTNGVVEGYIGEEACGENGFGYDPIFYLHEYQCSTAQLSMEVKNKISHRGKALSEMRKILIKEALEGKY